MHLARIANPLVVLFLLSAIVVIFNAVPSSVILDDSDQQIAAASSGGQKLPTLFVFAMGAAGIILFYRALWRRESEKVVVEYEQESLFSYIARGPPIMRPAAINL